MMKLKMGDRKMGHPALQGKCLPRGASWIIININAQNTIYKGENWQVILTVLSLVRYSKRLYTIK